MPTLIILLLQLTGVLPGTALPVDAPCAIRLPGRANELRFAWDDAGRLAQLETVGASGTLAQRMTFHWSGSELARVDIDGEIGGSPDGRTNEQLVIEWSGGRPRSVRYLWVGMPEAGNAWSWEWSAEGHTARITETSSRGTIGVVTATLDATGRLTRATTQRGPDLAVAEIDELDWTRGHVTARRRGTGSPPPAVPLGADAEGRIATLGAWEYAYTCAPR